MEESGGPPDAAAGAKVGPKASAARRLVGGLPWNPQMRRRGPSYGHDCSGQTEGPRNM